MTCSQVMSLSEICGTVLTMKVILTVRMRIHLLVRMTVEMLVEDAELTLMICMMCRLVMAMFVFLREVLATSEGEVGD